MCYIGKLLVCTSLDNKFLKQNPGTCTSFLWYEYLCIFMYDFVMQFRRFSAGNVNILSGSFRTSDLYYIMSIYCLLLRHLTLTIQGSILLNLLCFKDFFPLLSPNGWIMNLSLYPFCSFINCRNPCMKLQIPWYTIYWHFTYSMQDKTFEHQYISAIGAHT